MTERQSALGLYVHIPFCQVKCSYCAFVSQVGDRTLQQEYVAALCREISAAGGDFAARPVDTIFFGGGTPTVLPVSELAQILQCIRQSFRVAGQAEINIEANPGTVDTEALRDLRRAGFNRLSLGVQSFDDTVLLTIGRIHAAEEAEAAFLAARTAGFENISLDLMYGLPGQSLQSWRSSLVTAVRLRPEHLSCYGLKLEEGTRLEAAVSSERTALPAEEEDEAMYDELERVLPLQGFARYEISNYCMPGRECRHNLKYWDYSPFRGFGVAAHSFDGISRFANTEVVADYIRCIQAGATPEIFRETPDRAVAMGEFVFTALRRSEGLSLNDFKQQFGCDFLQTYGATVTRLKNNGLLEKADHIVFLTARGMKFGNQVFAEFLP